MPYRRVTYRSASLRITSQPWPFGGTWELESLRLLAQARWRPAADVAETAATVEVTVDLAGMDEDDFEVQLFDNGLVVEGRRRLPSCGTDAVYHAAGIPQGLFRLELPLGARVDPERVEARYERGLLHVTLPKLA
jgi:HSP20 family molecular chaperone IbpA